MTSTGYTYSLSPSSYCLPILHAALHPSSTVLGVFLSSTSSPSSSSSTTAGTIEVAEAIPLIHTNANVSPITEVALSLVEEYAKSDDKRIVGVYVAREYEDGLGRTGERVLTALKERFQGAFGLLLDNDKLAHHQFAYVPYLPTTSTTIKSITSTSSDNVPEAFTLCPTGLPAKLIRVIKEKKIHKGLKDFDDHLEDPDADWLVNSTVKSDIQRYLA
ncbi:uncharacterized protein IL334_005487 [Kwoniella shivajii]|uniref:MPN domain-containing protein n=1 Tax=Kwoniella shivajii TaxID=564305 RepID=A0ABZ1D6D7_9TREE|nr:hypothetical protein IL334_005487 [Kwoniella shivajii]